MVTLTLTVTAMQEAEQRVVVTVTAMQEAEQRVVVTATAMQEAEQRVAMVVMGDGSDAHAPLRRDWTGISPAVSRVSNERVLWRPLISDATPHSFFVLSFFRGRQWLQSLSKAVVAVVAVVAAVVVAVVVRINQSEPNCNNQST